MSLRLPQYKRYIVMSFINKLSNRIANFIINSQLKNSKDTHKKIEGIAKDIEILKQLKDELVQREQEIKKNLIEWDKTFDAIIDDIVIIDSEYIVRKANKSFLFYIDQLGGSWREVIGCNWKEIRDKLGLTNTECIVGRCFEEEQYQEAIVDIRGRTYSVLANPIFNTDGKITSVVRVSRDITKMEQQKQKIDRRGRIFEAISKMSKVLVEHEKWDIALHEVLKQLGEAVGASRTYLFKNTINDNRLCADLIDEWFNVESCSMTECINYDTLPQWRHDMELGQSVEGRIKECLHCEDKDQCVGLNELIVCAVPIFSNKNWWGFIGFDYNTDIKKWKEEDETLLRIASDIIGGVIHHRDRYYNCLNGRGNDEY